MNDKEFQKLLQKQLQQHQEDKHLSTLQQIAKRNQKKVSPPPKKNK